MNIFQTLQQGDSATWLDDPIELPDGRQADAPSGWTLNYALRGPTQLDLVATASGQSWSTSITTVQSAALSAGLYAWVAYVTKGSERITVASAELTIEQDITLLTTTFDPRSSARKALEQCEAAMSTFNATGGKVKKYEIAGRTMEFATIGELMTLHSFWQARVMTEQSQESVSKGLRSPRNLYVRFGRP